jgi:hypothetical protein
MTEKFCSFGLSCCVFVLRKGHPEILVLPREKIEGADNPTNDRLLFER